MDDALLLDLIRRENAHLREKVAILEDALSGTRLLPLEWGLTGQESRVFGVLVNRELASKEAVMVSLYGDKPDAAMEKIVDVYICKIRKKLKPFGIDIQTVWGRGWVLPREIRDRYRRAS